MDVFFLGAVSFLFLLFFSGVIFVGAKRVNFPYTIALVGMGIILGILIKIFPALSFLATFELTKELLLYVFLPILLFESAYNIKFREIIQHTRAISVLAVLGLIISAVISAWILYFSLAWLGMEISFMVLLAFGVLISATDPVAVLALFKEMWAPKRLTLIFEGESLFNDGTAIALLLVILWILIHSPDKHSSIVIHIIEWLFANFWSVWIFFLGTISFLLMIVMGFVLGLFFWYIASRILAYVKNSKILQIAFTLIIAHATFLFSEWVNHILIPVSPVIATTVAAMMIGNYWRYKLSTETRHIMDEYWEFFAFIANSMVFLLVGIMIVGLNIHFSELWLPIVISIFAVAIARAVSVYATIIPLNATKKEFHIPIEWMHLLSWGSLRGGLAIIMALFIPADFSPEWWQLETSVRDFVLALTVGCIIFTTFVKATTIPWVLKTLKITAPTKIEKIDYAQWKILFLMNLIAKIDSISRRGFLSDAEKEKISHAYQKELDLAHTEFFAQIKNQDELENILQRILALHALEIEKNILVNIFNHHEIPESIFRHMMAKLDSQIERVEEWKSQIKDAYEHSIRLSLCEKLLSKISEKFFTHIDVDSTKYIKSRTRMIILEKVLKKLENFSSIPEIADSNALKNIISRYENFFQNAKKIREELFHQKNIQELENAIVEEMLDIRKSEIIENLSNSRFISLKTEKKLLQKYLWNDFENK